MSKVSKRNVLGTNELNIIIEIWKGNIDQLRGVHRNVHVYSKMCEEAKKYGIILSSAEMRTRINNLTKKYRSETTKQDRSGGSPSEWTFYSQVHMILGNFKSIKKEEMDESSVHWMEDDVDLAQFNEIPLPLTVPPLATSQPSPPAAISPSSAFSSPSPSPATTSKKKSGTSEVVEILKKDQTLMEHFFKKTLENDQKTIELLQENNKLLAEFLKK